MMRDKASRKISSKSTSAPPGATIKVTNRHSHHALTLAIDGSLYLSPLQRDKIKVSHHISLLGESEH